MKWILKNKKNGMSRKMEWNEYWRIRIMEWVGIRNGMNIEGREEWNEYRNMEWNEYIRMRRMKWV